MPNFILLTTAFLINFLMIYPLPLGPGIAPSEIAKAEALIKSTIAL